MTLQATWHGPVYVCLSLSSRKIFEGAWGENYPSTRLRTHTGMEPGIVWYDLASWPIITSLKRLWIVPRNQSNLVLSPDLTRQIIQDGGSTVPDRDGTKIERQRRSLGQGCLVCFYFSGISRSYSARRSLLRNVIEGLSMTFLTSLHSSRKKHCVTAQQ